MDNKKFSQGVNAPLSYRKPRYDMDYRVIPWPAPEHPTADTYRVRIGNDGYTCDNEGT